MQNGAANGATTPMRNNFVNPSADPSRRIGMPTPGNGRMQNRGEYRPPMAAGVKRPPLSDVSNLQQVDGAGDGKKTKVEPAGGGADDTGQPGAVGS